MPTDARAPVADRIGPPDGAVEWPTRRPGIPFRAVLIGLLLIPVNAYVIIKTEVVWASVHATVLSLFFNAVATLFFLGLISLAWRRYHPRSALTQPELVVIYVMVSVATGLFGVDFLQMFTSTIAHPHRFVEVHPEWRDLFFAHLPRWLTVSDPEALRALHEGNTTFFQRAHLAAWAVPLAAWFAFTMVLLWMCLCLNVLIRREWSEHERLSFPIIQLPMAMTHPSSGFYRSYLLWIGFAAAGLLNLMRALHGIVPTFPDPVTKTDLARYLTSYPWNAIGWTPLCFYPFAVGLGFLIPLDLSFSCWFFYLFWKAQVVSRAALGFQPLAGQYLGDQSSGAWLGIGLLALWGSRRFLKQVARGVWTGKNRVDDSGEVMRYRTALIGFAAGAVGLTLFCWLGGMEPWAIAAFWAIYFLFMLAIMRMRAELGAPTHDLYAGGPDRLLTALLGTRAFAPGTLTMFSLFYWITYSYRSHPVTHQLEGLKLSERHPIPGRQLGAVIMLACAVAFVAWAAICLGAAYRYGFSSKMQCYLVPAAGESWGRLANWMQTPKSPEAASWTQLGMGFGLTLGMMSLRRLFAWFPLHPVGYAVSGSWTMSWLWFSLFIAWLVKWLVLHHGGLRTYRRVLPLFFGLILGDYVVGGLLSILVRVSYHGFFP